MKVNMETIFCRGFQMIMKVGMYALPWRTPKTMKGAGAVKKLPVAIQRKNLKKPLTKYDTRWYIINCQPDLTGD